MKTKLITLFLLLNVGFSLMYAKGSIVKTAIRSLSYSDEATQIALKVSGKTTLSKSAVQAFTKLTTTHGDDIVKTLAQGGIEVIEQAAKYGDDFTRVCSKITPAQMKTFAIYANKVTPLAAKYGDDLTKLLGEGSTLLVEKVAKHGDDFVIACKNLNTSQIHNVMSNTEELLPFIKKIGPDVFAKTEVTPGITQKTVALFGEQSPAMFANRPQDELIKMVSYAENADSLATKKMLYDKYEKLGSLFISKMPPIVLAGGVTTALVLTASNVTDTLDSYTSGIISQSEAINNTIIELHKENPTTYALPKTMGESSSQNMRYVLLLAFLVVITVVIVFSYKLYSKITKKKKKAKSTQEK